MEFRNSRLLHGNASPSPRHLPSTLRISLQSECASDTQPGDPASHYLCLLYGETRGTLCCVAFATKCPNSPTRTSAFSQKNRMSWERFTWSHWVWTLRVLWNVCNASWRKRGFHRGLIVERAVRTDLSFRFELGSVRVERLSRLYRRRFHAVLENTLRGRATKTFRPPRRSILEKSTWMVAACPILTCLRLRSRCWS